MPTYDYECTKCGYTFDAFQSMSDDPLVKCPQCNKNGLKRLIGGGMGIIFKGSGFYVTDSRTGGSKGAKKPAETTSEKSTGSDSSTAESGSKEKKPEAAGKTKAAS